MRWSIDLGLRRVGTEVRVQVGLAAQRGELPPHGGRREVDRRLVGVGDVRLLALHHGEQEAVLADADEFAPLAQLGRLLADDVAGGRRDRDRLAPGDPLLDHQLGLLVSQFEAGLLHQLAELVDAVLGPRLVLQLGFVLIEATARVGDGLPLGLGLALDLGALDEDLAHDRLKVGDHLGAGGVADAVVAGDLVALPLQVR
jgi:hypothetical protein